MSSLPPQQADQPELVFTADQNSHSYPLEGW
jgi:hypothetical protein